MLKACRCYGLTPAEVDSTWRTAPRAHLAPPIPRTRKPRAPGRETASRASNSAEFSCSSARASPAWRHGDANGAEKRSEIPSALTLGRLEITSSA
jgi:hypothetical protein